MSAECKINWAPPAEFPSLRPGEIHLWAASLEPFAGGAAADAAGLSPDEVARARSLHFAIDRQRFITARQFLRAVLAGYAGRDPAALAFSYGQFGKPMLSHRAASSGPLDASVTTLAFNQSHSGPLWLLAVAWNQPVGVDVEAVRDLDDLPLLEKAIFAPDEIPGRQSLPAGERRREFFSRWTRREAAAKFHGLGLEPSPEHSARAIAPDRVEAIAPAEGYVAALAYSGARVRLRQFGWAPSALAENVVSSGVLPGTPLDKSGNL